MRLRRFWHEVLMSFLMPLIYPYRVWVASAVEMEMNQHDKRPGAEADPDGAAPKSCCSGGHAHHTGQAHHDHPLHAAATVRDPVCGMAVDPATSKHRFDHG